jgi:hypothetical protein
MRDIMGPYKVSINQKPLPNMERNKSKFGEEAMILDLQALKPLMRGIL